MAIGASCRDVEDAVPYDGMRRTTVGEGLAPPGVPLSLSIKLRGEFAPESASLFYLNSTSTSPVSVSASSGYCPPRL